MPLESFKKNQRKIFINLKENYNKPKMNGCVNWRRKLKPSKRTYKTYKDFIEISSKKLKTGEFNSHC